MTDRDPTIWPRVDLLNIVEVPNLRFSEPDEAEQRRERLIKELTEGEPVEVRELDAQFFEAEPEFRLTISGRHAPDSGDPEQ